MRYSIFLSLTTRMNKILDSDTELLLSGHIVNVLKILKEVHPCLFFCSKSILPTFVSQYSGWTMAIYLVVKRSLGRLFIYHMVLICTSSWTLCIILALKHSHWLTESRYSTWIRKWAVMEKPQAFDECEQWVSYDLKCVFQTISSLCNSTLWGKICTWMSQGIG